VGNIEVIRANWQRVAMQTLIEHRLEEAKLKVLGEQLGLLRSSFYLCYKSRADLLDAPRALGPREDPCADPFGGTACGDGHRSGRPRLSRRA
jgi:hypothetical protein